MVKIWKPGKHRGLSSELDSLDLWLLQEVPDGPEPSFSAAHPVHFERRAQRLANSFLEVGPLLDHAAIHEEAGPAGLNVVAGAGDLSRRAQKFYVHQNCRR